MSLEKNILRDDTGATSIEYALIGSLIFLAIIAGVTAVGQETKETFENPELLNALN
jgi:pilus assembly protein Flp/PilA